MSDCVRVKSESLGHFRSSLLAQCWLQV